jgi:hypothetical protein
METSSSTLIDLINSCSIYDYLSNKSYNYGDRVVYRNNVYVSIIDNNNEVPSELSAAWINLI